MLPYWLMFVLWSLGAVQTERRRVRDTRILFFAGAAVLTAALIGLRFEVGGDWGSYTRMYDMVYFMSFADAVKTTDPGYAALNWLSTQGELGIVAVNLVCAALFMGGVGRLAWRQPNPALAVLVAVPYLIIVVAMGYTRQAAAIGIICFAVADASERRLIRLIVLIGVAALFHKTAVLMLPLLLVPVLRRNPIYGVFGAILFVALFVLVLRDTSDRLVTNYVQGDYDSQGATIRVSMNVAAAMLFMGLRKRIDMPPFEKSFWFVCSVLSFVAVPALLVSSASSGIDRISLYLIPLQIIVYARLPYILGNGGKALPSILIAVVGYCFLVQFVWLNYATNAVYWVPYKMS